MLPLSSRVKQDATSVVTGININMSNVMPTKPELVQSSYLIVLETVALFEVRERMPRNPLPKVSDTQEEGKRGNRIQRLKRLNAIDNVKLSIASEGDSSRSRSVLNLKELLSQPETPPQKNSFIDLTQKIEKWETIVEKHKRDPQFNNYATYTLHPVIVK